MHCLPINTWHHVCQGLADLEAFIGKAIKLQVEALYAQDQYDIILQ